MEKEFVMIVRLTFATEGDLHAAGIRLTDEVMDSVCDTFKETENEDGTKTFLNNADILLPEDEFPEFEHVRAFIKT